MGKKIELLLIINSLAGGGAERQFIELAKRINRNKYEISICLTVEKGIWFDELYLENIDIKVLNKKNRFDITVAYKLARLIKEKNPDVIHCWLFYSIVMTILASLISKWKGSKIAAIRQIPIKFYFYYYLTKLLSKYIEKCIAISGFVKKKLIREGIEEEKIVVVHNGIDLRKIENEDLKSKILRKEFGLEDNVILVGTIGRLEHIKGTSCFLKAIPYIRKETKNVKFMVIGEGSLKKSLKKLSENLKIEKDVIFTGFRKDIYKIMQMIDILVVPSLMETLSSVAIEAMAFKKPIVATNVGGIPEVVEDRVTGMIVPPNDPERMADAVVSLVKDKYLMQKMGEAGRKRARMFFDIEKTVKETEAIYNKLWNRKI